MRMRSSPELYIPCALGRTRRLTRSVYGQVRGSALIMEKLTSLGATTQHRITSMDVQQSVSPNAILVMVTGEISVRLWFP